MSTIRLTMAQAVARFLTAQKTEIDGEIAAALRRRLGDLRPRQRRRHGRGAARGARRRLPTYPRPQRAGHGACGHRLRQGLAPAPHDGLHHLDRPRRHQHGDGRRRRPCEPPAGAAAARRRLRQSPARSGAAADRELFRRHRLGQRLLPAGLALFRPHHPTRADHPRAAARHDRAHRSRRMRAGDAGAVPGHAGRGLRLSGKLLCGARSGRRAASAPTRPNSRDAVGAHPQREEALHRRRRRRALFRRRKGAGRLRRSSTAFPSARRRPASRACRTTIQPISAPSASPARAPPTRSPRRPMWCSRSARACRISPPAPGPCSRTRTGASSASTCRPSMPPSTTRCRSSPTRASGLEELSRALGGWKAARRLDGKGARARKPRWFDKAARYTDPTNAELPSDAQVIGAVQRTSQPSDVVVCAAGGLPGELHKHWKASDRPRLPHGIRLFLHGLRDRRRARREDGGSLARGDRDGGRRLLPHDEFGDRHLRDARARS